MTDETFKSVGKSCYALNKAIFSDVTEQEQSEPDLQKNEEDIVSETGNTFGREKLSIEVILDVIKENSDNLQYQDGFGVYEVKKLLPGIASIIGFFNNLEHRHKILLSHTTQSAFL